MLELNRFLKCNKNKPLYFRWDVNQKNIQINGQYFSGRIFFKKYFSFWQSEYVYLEIFNKIFDGQIAIWDNTVLHVLIF
jgi:hypothetical protein